MTEKTEVYTIDMAAEYLKVSAQTIRKLIETEELPAKKIGRLWRIRQEDLQEFLKSE
ncbi:helix-turn-helix domain-containing protein [Candidatus Contubernalis alkaliaceticus]|uniref:helix-turn-helix domain-containing protein n=1 Tax=Candidatus Contubernalis alkaliaceticus TaxID=338645 RepID=UPI001F4BE7DB|nr:helix-turn-helix domain-containing protein [Candidatus Contubernalis alkalaceticus]UNC92404.1 helix-turn-helix domain-containing protein [Candidatus Contubernalis alkalaceticus]